jgi:hypothetical protein
LKVLGKIYNGRVLFLVEMNASAALTLATSFGTVVQLICNFRQERGATKSAELTDFLSYLAYHKFEDIKGTIQNSTSLQLEIQELLKRDVSEVRDKLDLINQSIVALASRIDGLSGIASALGAVAGRLSDQAVAILQEFEKSGATQLGVFINYEPARWLLHPQGLAFNADRFLVEDVDALQAFGFIKLAEHNKSGEPFYALTRAGADYARTAKAQS